MKLELSAGVDVEIQALAKRREDAKLA